MIPKKNPNQRCCRYMVGIPRGHSAAHQTEPPHIPFSPQHPAPSTQHLGRSTQHPTPVQACVCVCGLSACACVCVCACACVGLFVNVCVCVGAKLTGDRWILLPFWLKAVAILAQGSCHFGSRLLPFWWKAVAIFGSHNLSLCCLLVLVSHKLEEVRWTFFPDARTGH